LVAVDIVGIDIFLQQLPVGVVEEVPLFVEHAVGCGSGVITFDGAPVQAVVLELAARPRFGGETSGIVNFEILLCECRPFVELSDGILRVGMKLAKQEFGACYHVGYPRGGIGLRL